MAVDYLRLKLLNIAKVAVYPATHYVQTTTNIVIYGSASLQCHLGPWVCSFRFVSTNQCFIFIFLRFYIYGNKPHGRRSTALKSPGGMALSWLMSISTGEWPSFFCYYYLLHMSCVLWHDIIPSFDKAHSTSHSFKDNPHILLIFYFSPIFWCGTLGTCQEGENVGRHYHIGLCW